MFFVGWFVLCLLVFWFDLPRSLRCWTLLYVGFWCLVFRLGCSVVSCFAVWVFCVGYVLGVGLVVVFGCLRDRV